MTTKNFIFNPRSYKEIDVWGSITSSQWNNPNWQDQNAIRDIDSLSNIIRLTKQQKKAIESTITTLKKQGKDPMRITPYYALLMANDPFNPIYHAGEPLGENLIDPIFWQSVPTPANLLFRHSGVVEAMSESSRTYGAAYQRYPNRVALFVAENTACASYCQHCQRTKSLDATSHMDREAINKGLFYISRNPNIYEVLITGGDALRISKKQLGYVLEELSSIPHVRLIRIATRVPVVMPMGVTDEKLDIIQRSANKHNTGIKKHVFFVTHTNHYHEITDDYAAAVQKIKDKGYTILNQTVLLNHVNADFATLAKTFTRMWWVGVKPYYLFQCHKEKGMLHFVTPRSVGKTLISGLRGWLSGTAVPPYVVNIEGGGGKVPLAPLSRNDTDDKSEEWKKLYGASADVERWDGKIIHGYKALGRVNITEYKEAVPIMDAFIGRPGIFRPSLNLVDDNGRYIETTNVKRPRLTNQRKARLLGYGIYRKGMPLTNPSDVADSLDPEFKGSVYSGSAK